MGQPASISCQPSARSFLLYGAVSSSKDSISGRRPPFYNPIIIDACNCGGLCQHCRKRDRALGNARSERALTPLAKAWTYASEARSHAALTASDLDHIVVLQCDDKGCGPRVARDRRRQFVEGRRRRAKALSLAMNRSIMGGISRSTGSGCSIPVSRACASAYRARSRCTAPDTSIVSLTGFSSSIRPSRSFVMAWRFAVRGPDRVLRSRAAESPGVWSASAAHSSRAAPTAGPFD